MFDERSARSVGQHLATTLFALNTRFLRGRENVWTRGRENVRKRGSTTLSKIFTYKPLRSRENPRPAPRSRSSLSRRMFSSDEAKSGGPSLVVLRHFPCTTTTPTLPNALVRPVRCWDGTPPQSEFEVHASNVGAQLEIELSSTREVARCLYNVLGDCNAETIRSETGASPVRTGKINLSAKAPPARAKSPFPFLTTLSSSFCWQFRLLSFSDIIYTRLPPRLLLFLNLNRCCTDGLRNWSRSPSSDILSSRAIFRSHQATFSWIRKFRSLVKTHACQPLRI